MILFDILSIKIYLYFLALANFITIFDFVIYFIRIMRTFILFIIGFVSFPAIFIKKVAYVLHYMTAYIGNNKKLYTKVDVQHTKLNAPSIDSVWNFLFSQGVFNKWNTIIKDLDFEKLHEEERLRFIKFVDEDESEMEYLLGSIRFLSDTYSKRISFIYTKDDVITNMTYLFEEHAHQIFATRTVTLRTAGSRNMLRMNSMRKDMNKKSKNEMKDLSVLTNKLYVASRVYKSVVQSPMSKFLRLT